MRPCHWCGQEFTPNVHGRPSVNFGPACRRRAGHYADNIVAWRQDLAILERAAAAYPVDRVLTFIRNELAGLRAALAAGPVGDAQHAAPDRLATAASMGHHGDQLAADDRPRSAYHEASHAAVAIALGLLVTAVSLRPGERFRAATFLAPRRGRTRWAREDQITVTLAGDL